MKIKLIFAPLCIAACTSGSADVSVSNTSPLNAPDSAFPIADASVTADSDSAAVDTAAADTSADTTTDSPNPPSRDPAALCGAGLQPGSPWAMQGRCVTRNAQTAAHGPSSAKNTWTSTTGQGASSPVIAADGTIYVGSDDQSVYAVRPDGAVQWKYTTAASVASTPTIGKDGTLYVGSRDHKLYAISPNGKLKWAFTAGYYIDSSPAIGSDGTVYITADDGALYALNAADGSAKWHIAGGAMTSVTIGHDGTLFVGSFDTYLHAIDPVTGTETWKIALDGGQAGYSAPAIGADGTIYISADFQAQSGGTNSSTLYAIRADGARVLWTFPMGGLVRGSPGIARMSTKVHS